MGRLKQNNGQVIVLLTRRILFLTYSKTSGGNCLKTGNKEGNNNHTCFDGPVHSGVPESACLQTIHKSLPIQTAGSI